MTVGVFILSFAVCAVLVFAVSVIGAKEQTFEEALAEQKRKKEAEKSAKSKGAKTVAPASVSSNSSNSKKTKLKTTSVDSGEKKKKVRLLVSPLTYLIRGFRNSAVSIHCASIADLLADLDGDAKLLLRRCRNSLCDWFPI